MKPSLANQKQIDLQLDLESQISQVMGTGPFAGAIKRSNQTSKHQSIIKVDELINNELIRDQFKADDISDFD